MDTEPKSLPVQQPITGKESLTSELPPSTFRDFMVLTSKVSRRHGGKVSIYHLERGGELEVSSKKDGRIQEVYATASIVKGLGRDQQEKDLYTFKCFEWGDEPSLSNTLSIKDKSHLGLMFRDLGLLQVFQEGEHFPLETKSTADLNSRLTQILLRAFKKV